MIMPDTFKMGTNISRIREIDDRMCLRQYRIFFLPSISSTYPFRFKTSFENIITPKNVIMHNIENAKCNFNNHIYLFSFSYILVPIHHNILFIARIICRSCCLLLTPIIQQLLQRIIIANIFSIFS